MFATCINTQRSIQTQQNQPSGNCCLITVALTVVPFAAYGNGKIDKWKLSLKKQLVSEATTVHFTKEGFDLGRKKTIISAKS